MSFRTRIVCWIPLIFVVVGAAAGQPVPRDLWFAYVDGEKRYGSLHVEVSEQADGHYLYRVESRLLVDLFGAQPQEITTRGDFVVTRDLQLVSVRSESTSLSGTVKTVGEVKDGMLSLAATSGGETRRSSIQLDPEGPVLLDLAVEDWLASVPPDQEESSRNVIDHQQFASTRYTASARRGGAGYDLADPARRSPSYLRFRCDERGLLLEARYGAPVVHVVRCTEEEARSIDYLVMDGKEVLTFPLDKDIPAPHRLSSLTVRLRWKSIPFEEFELEDPRQSVVERSENDEHYTAVLRIRRPAANSGEVPFPLKGEEFAATLAETAFIKPRHDEIVHAARGVVEGEKTALGAVRALSSWVYGHIEGELIAETLSGPEVLARKKGKCTEYSTLFASLARSVGIPTRVALGERLVAGQWMGHMWNEAYVGEWIAVDATVDEVGDSFSLLKFIHSDTVDGTQPLRWKLTESLGIEVLDFEIDPSALASGFRTGVENGTYTNVDYACRITSPVAAWKIEPEEEPGTVLVRFRVPGKDDVLVHFVAFALPEGTDPRLITDARLRTFGANDGFELLRDEPREVNGAKARTTRFDYLDPGDGGESARHRVTEVVWVTGGFGYLLNVIAPAAEHDAVLTGYEKLVSSFKALSP